PGPSPRPRQAGGALQGPLRQDGREVRRAGANPCGRRGGGRAGRHPAHVLERLPHGRGLAPRGRAQAGPEVRGVLRDGLRPAAGRQARGGQGTEPAHDGPRCRRVRELARGAAGGPAEASLYAPGPPRASARLPGRLPEVRRRTL
ncbi:MAG: hypothetical protein AVDCRST_MAG03-315, partial [uncultured Rubrobacteraceae bacterium]